MNRRGFILIELLVAASLMSMAGAGLYSGLSQAMKMERSIKEAGALYGGFKLLWLRADKDLRNTLSLRDYPFMGKQDEMSFPILNESNEIHRIRYFIQEGDLLRSDENLPERLVKEPLKRSVLLKGVERVKS